MNVMKIAWRSIQHRGFGSFLTVLSMALGVMLVVGVLTIHGVVSKSFKSNSSFGYDIIMGARGGKLQLTLNTVFYLSEPIETIPYEYYLAFCDKETREKEFENSITQLALDAELNNLSLAAMGGGSSGPLHLLNDFAIGEVQKNQWASMGSREKGLYAPYVEVAVPLCLGDYYEVPNSSLAYRVMGTKSTFFTELVLDIDTGEKFQFESGRNMKDFDPDKNGYFEAVIGATVAKQAGLKVGDPVYPTHGVPDDDAAHVHEQGFEVVGILEPTGTANDRVVFINIEGFFLMEDHVKPINEQAGAASQNNDNIEVDLEDGNWDDEGTETPNGPNAGEADLEGESTDNEDDDESIDQGEGLWVRNVRVDKPIIVDLEKKPLAVEQRELTAILIRAAEDEYGMYAMHLQDNVINAGDMEEVLNWTPFRPLLAQKSAQAVNPIKQIEILFTTLVDPIRWLLLILTMIICVVSGISILVGIYNSMNQRKNEIAVMRALGANRNKVMIIMLLESVLLAMAGGLLGWIGGHALNAAASPYFEAQTGVRLGFFSFAPPVPLGTIFGGNFLLPDALANLRISPEFMIIPGLILLAILVGIYPAISAYRTDVSKHLGK